MLKQACLKVKADKVLQDKIANASTDDVAQYIATVRAGKIPMQGTAGGGMLLNVVNSVTLPVPHTNDAAKASRKKVFSLQLQFGFPFIFFTVTPDDSCSFIVCIYIGMKFRENENIEDFTVDDITKRASLRHEY